VIEFAICWASRQVESMNGRPVIFRMLIQAVIAAVLALVIDSPLFPAFLEGFQIAQITKVSMLIQFHVLRVGCTWDDAHRITPP